MSRLSALALLLSATCLAACAGKQFEPYEGDPSLSLDDWPDQPDEGEPSTTYDPFSGEPSEGAFVAEGGDPALELFDPQRRYMVGYLRRNNADGAPADDTPAYDVPRHIAPLEQPDRWIFGLPSRAAQFAIRPSDGRLRYLVDGGREIRVFHCDGCVHDYGPYETADHERIDLTRNDGVIATPPCFVTERFEVDPEGQLLYLCAGSTQELRGWHDEGGARIIEEHRGITVLLELGYEGTALRKDGVLDIETGELAQMHGDLDQFVTGDAYASGAAPDGYWLIPWNDMLYHVGFDGLATAHGSFAALPERSAVRYAELDEDGALTVVVEGGVRRIRMNGEEEQLYTPPPVETVAPALDGERSVFVATGLFGDWK